RPSWRRYNGWRPDTVSPLAAVVTPPGGGGRQSASAMDTIYLDNNDTTPTLPAVWEAMRPFLGEVYGTPASAHQHARPARRALEDARERAAALLDAHPDEVLFTSGATEANNLALFGLAGDPPGHLIVSAVEHPSVAEPAQELARRGFEVSW